MRTRAKKHIGPSLVLLVVASLLISGPALALSQPEAKEQRSIAAAPVQQAVTIDLCAATGSVTMPDGLVVPIWGFAIDPGGCATPVSLPGPTLVVNEGAAVTVNLTNYLAEPVSIVFPGQSLIPDTAGAAGGGGTASYTFTATNPGSYLYESGTNTSVQLPMGLYGALVVRPALGASYAYNDASTEFDVESVLVLSEIDPALNAAPATFNMLDYAPTYWLINGQAYPGTAPIAASAGDRVLLRYLNAGLTHHTMMLLGTHQRVLAMDAYPLNFPYSAVSEIIASGQTLDTLATMPAVTAAASFPLYSRSMYLTNGTLLSTPHFPGGMLTFVNVTP